MTFTTRRILRVTMAAAIAGMMSTASGCAKHPQPASPAAAAPDKPDTPDAPAKPDTPATPDKNPGAAASASGAPPSSSDAAAAALSVDDQVREALFRYLFEHNESGSKDSAKVYFLAIVDEGGKQRDPSREFLARFAGHRPRVEPVSRMASNGTFEGVRHRETGDRGLLFHVGAITRMGDDAVEVEGGYYEANLSASGGTYLVERKDGVWVVTKPKMIWIA